MPANKCWQARSLDRYAKMDTGRFSSQEVAEGYVGFGLAGASSDAEMNQDERRYTGQIERKTRHLPCRF
jgi:hypothetical protein